MNVCGHGVGMRVGWQHCRVPATPRTRLVISLTRRAVGEARWLPRLAHNLCVTERRQALAKLRVQEQTQAWEPNKQKAHLTVRRARLPATNPNKNPPK